MFEHPFAKHECHTFQRHNWNGKGDNWIARFWTGAKYLPIHFPGKTEEAARGSLETFRFDTVMKNEARVRAKNARKNRPIMDKAADDV
jgi:hypothetical protein